MERYRAGIVGCGKIASEFADDPNMKGDVFTHAEAYFRNPETNLAAICDSDPAKLEQCGNRWNVEARYTDLQDMIVSENLDIVSVFTPDDTHYSVIKEILTLPKTVKLILCEKPLATSVEEAEKLIAISRERNVVLSVVYMRRFAQNYRALRDFIHSGQLGEVQAISGWYTKGVVHNGTHWFDALRFLVGEVDWVMSWQRCGEKLNDPTLDVILGVENGVLASLRACDEKYFTIFDMDIQGTLGRIRLLDSGFQIEHSSVIDSERYSGYQELKTTQKTFGDRKNLMLHAVEDAVSSLRTGKPPACTAEDGLEVLLIAASALESAQKAKVIRVHK